ncbi:MAG: suppressor of fused domain protein [Clostridia bacterium]|nr:suppressor of fused domain protein [Clostridia bacterium]MBR2296327.1 suppressor of fused domain protein [Clostridia bacterium]
MKIKEMDKLTKHFDTYFEQSDCLVIHPVVDCGEHIDVLLYEPSEKYPFWKLVTMGASDYKMPSIDNTIANRNEYIMFVDASEDLTKIEIVGWYHEKLLSVAQFASSNSTHITYGHSFEWENDDPNDEMVGAFIEFPQVIENANVLRCKLGMIKTIACLQVVLLNDDELKKLLEIGPQEFSEYLYPNNNGRAHFLCERHRSERF